MATGQARTTRWFQRDDQRPDEAGVKFINEQLRRIEHGLAIAFQGGAVTDHRLKAQVVSKRKLLKVALDYYRGKRAYFQLGRYYTIADIPKTEKAFLNLVKSEVNDIPLMFERANITLAEPTATEHQSPEQSRDAGTHPLSRRQRAALREAAAKSQL
jgi:hypothetical protein